MSDDSASSKLAWLKAWGPWLVAIPVGVYSATNFFPPLWTAMGPDQRVRVVAWGIVFLVIFTVLALWFSDKIFSCIKDARSHRSSRDPVNWPESKIAAIHVVSSDAAIVITRKDYTDIEFTLKVRNSSPFTLHPRTLTANWSIKEPGPDAKAQAKTVGLSADPYLWKDKAVESAGLAPILPGEDGQIIVRARKDALLGPAPVRIFLNVSGVFTIDPEKPGMFRDLKFSTQAWGDCREARPTSHTFSQT